MKAIVGGPYWEFSKLDAVRQVATIKAFGKTESEVKEKADEIVVKDGVIQQLQQQLEHAQVGCIYIYRQYHIMQCIAMSLQTTCRAHGEAMHVGHRQPCLQLEWLNIFVSNIVSY